MGNSATPTQANQASSDYRLYFSYISRLDDDNKNAISEAIIDGIQRNPYAAWEWGMVARTAGQYAQAAEIHNLAARAFEEIGDKPRSTVCRLDEGIDLASDDKADVGRVKVMLREAIDSTVGVDGRDVNLLQRVVAKEGEGRIVLAGLLWGKEKGEAEEQFGVACARLDELNADYNAREQDRLKKGGNILPPNVNRLAFSIDDIVGADEASCSRFKNDKFVEEKLVWSQSLRSSVKKFLSLAK